MEKRVEALILVFSFLFFFQAMAGENKLKFRQLTPEEERVIVHRGTEPPFSGKYVNHHEDGTYTCKRCGALLFRSDTKFDSHCGWPSFDDAIPGAVERRPDPDGVRTEIVCAACGAHLGHVFEGEGFTPKNTRYCVNSISLSFIPADEQKAVQSGKEKMQTEKAYFAGGCFWGVEYLFQKAPGVISTRVGYMGGHTENPTYEEVCTGTTGHAETVEVVFDPSAASYEEIAKLFFEIHDPTQVNRQGPDVGEQYRSVVFYTSEAQKKTAEKLIEILKRKGYKVATSVEPATTFWEAEKYHQDYYVRKGGTPYCHFRQKRF
ncbi:MAG: bifunctional methionine sulfoxide reductase B/A protein [Calditrichaeota bacterium]|nr:bifunctional methionine sulfoxide reductase B/A protein [Calditrichota bacterium]